MIESISTNTYPTEKRTVNPDNREQESSFLDLLTRDRLEANDFVQSTESENPDQKSGFDIEDKREVEFLTSHFEHPDLSPFYSKISNHNSSNAVQHGDGEIYESRWYAIGHLSYKTISYHVSTDVEATINRGNRTFNVADNTDNNLSRTVYSPKPNIERGTDPSVRTQAFRSYESPTIKQSGCAFQVMASVPEYLRKKITFTENDDIFHLYIRDYSLSEKDKTLLIDSVLESHRRSNTKLSLLIINGEEYQLNRGGNNHAS